MPLLGLISFSVILTASLNIWVLGFLLMLTGAASSSQILSFTAIKENNASHVKATAVSINNMIVVLSGALFQPLIGWLLHEGAKPANINFSMHDFKISFLPILFSYLIASILAIFFIKESFQSDQLLTLPK